VWEEEIPLLDKGIGVKGNRGYLEPARESPLVQSLDVTENVLELKAACVDCAGPEPPEHEGIVGIGAMTETDPHGGGG
jgi:hypothetical protein